MNHSLKTLEKQYFLIREAAQQDLKSSLTDVLSANQLDEVAKFADNKLVPTDFYNSVKKLHLTGELSKGSKLLLEIRRHEAIAQDKNLLSQVEHLAKILNVSNIDFVLLKGTALICANYFDTPGQRIVSDIDFLVRKTDLDNVYSSLNKGGYESQLNLGSGLSEYWNSKHLPPFTSKKYHFRLECHHTPFEHTFRFEIPASTHDIFNKSKTIIVGTEHCKVPCPEHLLMSTFYHSEIADANGVAGINNYRSFLDSSAILTKHNSEINWGFVKETVAQKNYEKYFYHYLNRISNYFDSRVPESGAISDRTHSSPLLFSTNIPQSIRQLIVSITVHCREFARAISATGRKERREIGKYNPDNWKYLPIYKQILTPKLLRSRIRYLFNMPSKIPDKNTK